MWKCQECPARYVKCNGCGKVGHYKRVCRSSDKVQEVHQEFLGAIYSGSENQWDATVRISGKSVKFRIDTGAEVTVFSDSTHKDIGSPRLEQPDRILRGPSNRKFPVLGLFVQTEKKNCCHRVTKLHVPRLAIESLEILARIRNIPRKNPKEKFPSYCIRER